MTNSQVKALIVIQDGMPYYTVLASNIGNILTRRMIISEMNAQIMKFFNCIVSIDTPFTFDINEAKLEIAEIFDTVMHGIKKSEENGIIIISNKTYNINKMYKYLYKISSTNNKYEIDEIYKSMNEIDKIDMIKTDLNETKTVLHNTMISLLERDAKLDDVLKKSEELNVEAQRFLIGAKKLNTRCCSIS